MLPPLFDVDCPLVDRGQRFVPRIGCAHVDPGLEISDHLVGKFARGRHLEAVVLERCQQETLILVAGHHRRTALAPLGHPAPRIDEQAGLQLAGPQGVGRMALVAVLGEDRPDLLLEEGDLLRRGRCVGQG